MPVAALVNGISSHAAELDDGVISGIVHPGAPLLSALLPVAEEQSIDGRRLLLGIVSGYEATVRLANAIQPSHKMRGYHATATCGGIGAALGILNMTAATEETMKNAVSAAAVSAGGSLKVLEDGSQLKPFNPGHAALTAVVSVALAKAGFKGPDDVMSGRAGFLAMMADAYEEEALFPERDQKLCIESVYVKPYAACRYCHPAIEAALQIRCEKVICVEDIEWIRVATYKLAVDHHDHTVVQEVSSAKMSIPFSVAAAMVTGRAGIEEYSEACIRDTRIVRLAQKVSVIPDEHYSAVFPKQTPARVEIRCRNGSDHVREVFLPKGEPGNPLSDDELNNKFMSLAAYAGLTSNQSATIRDAVWNLPDGAERLYELL
ncbi:MAG: 2-methylcitrate dehydratase [Verrucomicrobia bacterium ADurb.Bin006]|nr:MAG: 2-methylcitrate dehydratase [Verrucomicrobia bacterium ADurb.Bin006]